MCCPCCMTSLYSRTFYSILLRLVISLVTYHQLVTNVTVWQINPNLSCSKNRKEKKKKKKNKVKRENKNEVHCQWSWHRGEYRYRYCNMNWSRWYSNIFLHYSIYMFWWVYVGKEYGASICFYLSLIRNNSW